MLWSLEILDQATPEQGYGGEGVGGGGWGGGGVHRREKDILFRVIATG